MNSRFLSNLFHSFSENVGGLLDRLRPAKTEKKDLLLQLAETLLSGRGEASDVAVAREFLAAYDGLTEIEGLSFLTLPDGFRETDRSGRAFSFGQWRSPGENPLAQRSHPQRGE